MKHESCLYLQKRPILWYFFCTRPQKSWTQLSLVFPAFFFWWLFPFSTVFVFLLQLLSVYWAFSQLKNFFRESIIKKFLSSGEEGNYPPSFSLGFLNVSVHIWRPITLFGYYCLVSVPPAVLSLLQGVPFSCKRRVENDLDYGRQRVILYTVFTRV